MKKSPSPERQLKVIRESLWVVHYSLETAVRYLKAGSPRSGQLADDLNGVMEELKASRTNLAKLEPKRPLKLNHMDKAKILGIPPKT